MKPLNQQTDDPQWHKTQGVGLWEMALIVGLLFVYFGSPPPDANEAHYLVKAKHYWNPTWCGPDVFLDSRDAHTVFYWTIGWLTRWWSLTVVAWVGRLLSWVLFAIGWQRLSWVIVPRTFVSVVTAALFVVLADHCHLAGEWALGGLEAKPIAYVLLLFALRALVRGQWRIVWVWLGLASAFHVLVGGWSVVATAMAWIGWGKDRPAVRSLVPSIMLGLVLALPGLLPAIMLSAGADAGVAREANEIYVFGRLAHHLAFHRFEMIRFLSFGVLFLVWGTAWWSVRMSREWSRLNLFVLGALCIALAGALIDVVLMSQPAIASGLLKYYWFRLSDIAVPLAVSMAVPLAIVLRDTPRPQPGSTARQRGFDWTRLAWTLVILGPTWLFAQHFLARQIDFRPGALVQPSPAGQRGAARARQQYRAWLDVCGWISRNTRPTDRFLTPRGQQTFKWYAQRAEVVCWKDVPQDPASVVAWWQLLQEIYPPDVVREGLAAWPDRRLQELADTHQFEYILLDRQRATRRLGFQRVYPELAGENAWFELYKVRRASP